MKKEGRVAPQNGARIIPLRKRQGKSDKYHCWAAIEFGILQSDVPSYNHVLVFLLMSLLFPRSLGCEVPKPLTSMAIKLRY